jgi:hypothetical protein
MAYNVIDNASIVQWVFAQPLGHHGFYWELLHGTIQKTLARLQDLIDEQQHAEGEQREFLGDAIVRSQADIRHLMLLIFTRLTGLLRGQLQDVWASTVAQRVREIARRYFAHISPFVGELEALLAPHPALAAVCEQLGSLGVSIQ